jgi:hypothetical protein
LSNEDDYSREFTKFGSRFGRNYKSQDEYKNRLSIFKKTYDLVQKHNSENAEKEGFTLEVNKFADLSDEEFDKLLGLKNADKENVEDVADVEGQDFNEFDGEENDDA